MLAPPVQGDDGSILIGAHIIRPVDPISKLRAHAEACDGTVHRKMITMWFYDNFIIADLPIRMRPKKKDREAAEVRS